ncbi:MAG: cellulase family glycosylhydrolase [Armatimonadetes bacterium]|nr:cellulase family glycosylhydrolase [Armatimonadota bacterium]MDE2206567.1 cellulase family glycosylhydrolase [Armatimonadota bacterium]
MNGTKLLALAGTLSCALASSAIGASSTRSKPAVPPLQLHVAGTQLRDSNNRVAHLHGVNCASMEWTSDGQGHILTTINTAITVWHANIIRLPLSEDRWFGRAPEQKNGPAAYRALVGSAVQECESQGCYILLDLHWNDADEWGKNIGQHKMPDQHSILFWKSLAPIYKNNPAVLFDLYNEPHDVSWDVWQNGGQVTEQPRVGFGGGGSRPALTYKAAGMQQLLDTVRAAGAKNVVVAGGLNWAYDMDDLQNGHALVDRTGYGIIYSNHDYPIKGETMQQWLARMVAATAKAPVIVSEFGAGGRPGSLNSGAAWLTQVMQILHQHDWNWIAWDMHPSAGPTLVSDWNYTPTPVFGVMVKDALAGNYPAGEYSPTAGTGARSP